MRPASLWVLPVALTILLSGLTACTANQPEAAVVLAAPAETIPVAEGTVVPEGALATAPPADTRVPPTTTPTPPPTATPTANPNATPTPRPAGTPPRVGIQVGHWKQNELPEELARLRTSTGAYAAGVAEVEVNMLVAERVVARLQEAGVTVDLLPATIPPFYDADAFVTIHADGAQSTANRGYKLATPWRTSTASQMLLDAISATYGNQTGLPLDGAVTVNMRGYYAFNARRHQNAVARTTPAVIVELGFLTNPRDRAMMLNEPDRMAKGVADGILAYLQARDPNDGAALLPPDFKVQRPVRSGVAVRAAPRDDGRVLAEVTPEHQLVPFQQRDGWYQVFVRGSQGRILGWVKVSDVAETLEPTPTLPPSSS